MSKENIEIDSVGMEMRKIPVTSGDPVPERQNHTYSLSQLEAFEQFRADVTKALDNTAPELLRNAIKDALNALKVNLKGESNE